MILMLKQQDFHNLVRTLMGHEVGNPNSREQDAVTQFAFGTTFLLTSQNQHVGFFDDCTSNDLITIIKAF